MMKTYCWAMAILFCVGCGPSAPQGQDLNRWADERLWPVLQAQEQRDTEALCALLKDSSAVVREASALAFASVQDTAGIHCLFGVLMDAEPVVRTAAVFALGYVADSAATLRMGQWAQQESDGMVQRVMQEALLLAKGRNGLFASPHALIDRMKAARGHERVQAADLLRRMPSDLLNADSAVLFRAWVDERDTEVKRMLLRALAKVKGEQAERGLWQATETGLPWGLRLEAITALQRSSGHVPEETLLRWINDAEPQVSCAADALLAARRPLPLAYLRLWANRHAGAFGIPANQQPEPDEAALVGQLSVRLGDPYAEAERIRLLAAVEGGMPQAELMTMLRGDHPAVVKQAALDVLINSFGSSDPLLFAPIADSLVNTVLTSGDAGLIARLCEALLGTEMPWFRDRVSPRTLELAKLGLHPIKDLEALQLLGATLAAQRGDPAPLAKPAFNHPIDPDRLHALPQGQRYRIVTGKGEIILATDVDHCPGSSLAFDSLVTAGYYNGKAFHRMVPNFVVQGGCPRGDGYGGMPWTLRTEIGRKPFTAGSVGLASAGRDTESCQFFITHSATPHLDGRYTRFGEVVQGMDVVWRLQVGDAMERVERLQP